MTKVAVVTTSHSDLGDTGKKTGLWFEELAAPYYVFKDKGYDVVVASIKGGDPPVDAGSLSGDFVKPECCQRALKDEAFDKDKKETVAVDQLKESELDAIYLAGGHGVCWDFVGSEGKALVTLVEQMYTSGKVVGAVCHGVAGLFDAKVNGEALLKGKKVAGFSDTEEAAVACTDIVPVLVETKYKELGAIYEKVPDWHPHAVVDGKLVTGQNPQSSTAAAEKMVELLA